MQLDEKAGRLSPTGFYTKYLAEKNPKTDKPYSNQTKVRRIDQYIELQKSDPESYTNTFKTWRRKYGEPVYIREGREWKSQTPNQVIGGHFTCLLLEPSGDYEKGDIIRHYAKFVVDPRLKKRHLDNYMELIRLHSLHYPNHKMLKVRRVNYHWV